MTFLSKTVCKFEVSIRETSSPVWGFDNDAPTDAIRVILNLGSNSLVGASPVDSLQ